MKIKDLAREVATLLGESLELECQPEESPFPGIEERVRLLAPSLLATLIMEKEVNSLDGFKSYSATVAIDEEGVGSVELPDDFLRLVAIQMSDWRRPVAIITDESSEKGAWQWSRWRGVRGSPERPVVMAGIVNGKHCLRLFTTSAGASLSTFLYMAIPCVTEEDTIDVPDGMRRELTEALEKDFRR